MSQERTLATRLIALRVVKDMVAAADTETRKELLKVALIGDGITAAVAGPDGPVPVGKVTATKGRKGSTTASVVDEQALLVWCRTHRPTAVAECVRSSDQRALLEEVKTFGGIMDPLTGVVSEVPGIIVTEGSTGKPGLMVVPHEDAEAVMREAFADGRLRLSELTALPEATS